MRETPGFPWVMFFFSGFPGVFFDIFYRLLIVISYFRNCRGRAFSGISHDIPMISHSFHDFPHSFPPFSKGNPWANSRQGAAGWQRRRRRGRRPWWRWSGRPSTWTSPPGEWIWENPWENLHRKPWFWPRWGETGFNKTPKKINPSVDLGWWDGMTSMG